MADFITAADFKTRAYQEKIDAISQGDITLLPTAIATASAIAKGFIGRFDIADLFSKAGDDRDPLLLGWIKDIAVWEFIGLANPGIDYDDCATRRNNAIALLTKVQNSTFVPVGWKLATNSDPNSTADPSTSFHITSQPKRNTYR